MRSSRSKCLLAAILTLVATPVSAAQPPAPTEADIDRFVERAMETFSVPGVAVGIVKDGHLVLAKGYGVRTIGRPDEVDPQTLFAIGSNTKSFTAAALAILVDEGKIRWDDRVVDYLPKFQLHDPYVTREFTIRDLLSHRSGLGSHAGDLMVFPNTDFTRDEIFAALKHFRPATSFRSEYAYDNLLYMVAGQIIPAVTGMSWEAFVEDRVLDRLGMTSCTTVESQVPAGANRVSPHAVVEGRLRIVEPLDVSVVAAAGSIQCNLAGMAKWMMLQLGEGKTPDGRAIFSSKQQQEMWKPHTIGPVPPALTKLHRTHFRAYGLGWNVEDFQGYKRVFHSGGVLGEVSHVTLLPELELGIVVLTNQQASEVTNAITFQIAKAYIGAGQQDWISLFKAAADEERAEAAAADKLVADSLRKAGRPPLPMAAYTGTYHDPWRGTATVRQQGDRLILKFSRTDRLEGALHHYRNGVFVVRWDDRSLASDAFVRFTTGFDGAIEGMSMQGLPTADSSFDFQNLNFRKQANDR